MPRFAREAIRVNRPNGITLAPANTQDASARTGTGRNTITIQSPYFVRAFSSRARSSAPSQRGADVLPSANPMTDPTVRPAHEVIVPGTKPSSAPGAVETRLDGIGSTISEASSAASVSATVAALPG